MHFNTSVQRRYLHEAGAAQVEIKMKSDCVFKSLAVWGQGRERQRGRLDEDI